MGSVGSNKGASGKGITVNRERESREDKINTIIDKIKNDPLLLKHPNSTLILKHAIEQSDYVMEDTEIKADIYKQLDNEKGQVNILSYNYKSIPDTNGYVDADVHYTVSKTNWTGAKEFGIGKAVMKTKSKDNWKLMKIKVLDFKGV